LGIGYVLCRHASLSSDHVFEETMTFRVPECFRIKEGPLGTEAKEGNQGAFMLTGPAFIHPLFAIASNGMGWEHVSVSSSSRCPTWDEMVAVKDLFWGENDAVIQIHPPKKNYVNCHPFCLHLWRPSDGYMKLPPSWMVGPAEIVP
jgi:hypothetical protein